MTTLKKDINKHRVRALFILYLLQNPQEDEKLCRLIAYLDLINKDALFIRSCQNFIKIIFFHVFFL